MAKVQRGGKGKSRNYHGVPLYGKERAFLIGSGNHQEVYGIGHISKGGKLDIKYVMKKPKLPFTHLFKEGFTEQEIANWKKIGKAIKVPKHLNTFEHPTLSRVNTFEYAGTDLLKKYDFSAGVNRRQFIKEHSQALNSILVLFREHKIILDAKPANFTDGDMPDAKKLEVHYVDEGFNEMPGSDGIAPHPRELGYELGQYLFHIYFREYGLTGKKSLTNHLTKVAKDLIKQNISLGRSHVTKALNERLNELMAEMEPDK